MRISKTVRAGAANRRLWRRLARIARREPLDISAAGHKLVVVGVDSRRRRSSVDPDAPAPSSQARPRPLEPGLTRFTVLCQIDAYANYAAEIDAETAEDAAEIANESPGDHWWESWGTVEFDDRRYVTLDANGEEIEDTAVGDF